MGTQIFANIDVLGTSRKRKKTDTNGTLQHAVMYRHICCDVLTHQQIRNYASHDCILFEQACCYERGTR